MSIGIDLREDVLADVGIGGVEDVRGLACAEALEYVVEQRRVADAAEARVLAAAVHWIDLHPVTAQNPPAGTRSRAALLVQVDGRVEELPLTGPGTPGVAEFAVEELAAALGISYHSCLRLVSEAVELCFRLPQLWALVQSGRLQAWRARAVARETVGLSLESVAFVDRHVAVVAAKNRVPTLGKLRELVHEARLQCDPDQAAGIEQAALDARGVWFDHRESTATTLVTARMDTLDAIDLDASVDDLATTIGRLGDQRDLDVRRATALGMLAHPQRALDLVHGEREGAEASDGPPRGLNGSKGTLYLHVSVADLATCAGAGHVEKLGPATLELLADWLQRVRGVTVRPVLDPGRDDAIDQHDPSPWMREAVMLRDQHCVFPGCTVAARGCDLDHVEAYVSPDDGGPPGQTSPSRLACLCRRHHRMKTFAGWRYHRLESGDYEWHSPLGRSYRTT
jgi:hypothetical protein